MVELIFLKSQYDFLCKYVEEIKEYEKNVVYLNNKVKLEMTSDDFFEFQCDFNSSIVYYGMDNQDTVNEIGIELYKIYDELLYQKRNKQRFFNRGKCGTEKFLEICKQEILKYVNEHIDETDNKTIIVDDVFCVWNCKTLQNNKALLSTTLSDGMYYELTHNGDKKELYLDAYKKIENKCIKLD